MNMKIAKQYLRLALLSLKELTLSFQESKILLIKDSLDLGAPSISPGGVSDPHPEVIKMINNAGNIVLLIPID